MQEAKHSIRRVPIVQEKPGRGDVRVAVDVVNPPCVETARPPHQTVDFIVLGQQVFGQIRPILAGNAGDHRFF